MGFSIASADLVKEKVDVIVNSLGIVTTHYGTICRAILNAVKDNELKAIIDGKNGQVGIGDMFFTDGYNLPAKKILHLVTPFSKNDPDMSAFETALRDTLIACREAGLTKVSLPLIGTIGNGYNTIEAQNILMEMCSSFANHFPEMEIRVVKKPYDYKDPCNDRYPSNFDMDYVDDEIMMGVHRDVNAFEEAMKRYYDERNVSLIREKRDYDKSFFNKANPLKPLGWIKRPKSDEHQTVLFTSEEKAKASENVESYIATYIKKRYPNQWDLQDKAKKTLNTYVGNGNTKNGSKYVYELSYGNKKVPNRMNMFKAALALEMNEDEAYDFLSTFGISPLRNDPTEQCILCCIRLRIYNMNSIDMELRNRRLKPLFV